SNNLDIILYYYKCNSPVVNHAQERYHVLNASRQINDVNEAIEVMTQMAAEDFAYYLHHKPGAFFFTGAQKTDNAVPHHHPMFDIDERALPIAAKVLIGAYFETQAKE